MSNSKRAKERRSRRARLKKHERVIMASQHFGDKYARKKKELAGAEPRVARR